MLRVSSLPLGMVLLVAACGGGNDEARPAVREELASLCEDARSDIEALGLPGEKGFAVMRPWANRGTRLAREIGALEGASPTEDVALRSLSNALDEYYAGLRLGYTIYMQTGSSEAYAATIAQAKAFLAKAEKAAARLGATECTVQPFADE